MSRWDGLSPRERAELMALFAREGVTDVRRMRTIYDEGGDIKPAVVDADYPRMKETLDLVNSSDANFVSRLKDANRRTIPDWEVKGNVATHKLGWTTMDGKAYVYPLVQEIDGELYDFTDPKYGFDDYDKAAIEHALSTGDYVAMPKESDARWFTESYKNHYPTFNKYSGGGDKSGDSEVMVRLGEDDYLHQGELDPAVVVAESKKPMTYIPREMFNIVKDKPASEEEMALRKVVDSLVRKDKPTPLTILDSYRSAYRNPFIVNPFAYNIPIVNRFGLGGDEQSVDEEIYDVLPQASRVVLGNQSRRGLKRAAFKAVFDGNPYNPDEKDTFLEDYLADNNIVQFENDKRKRIFDRAIRRNMRDKEDLTSENGFGIYPTKYNGYSKVVMPDGQTTFIRSEKPMERDDILKWIPMVGDAHDVQDAWQDINDGDYMSAGVILALSALPGPVGQKVKPWAKRMQRKYKRYIEKRIKDGNVLSVLLHPNDAHRIHHVVRAANHNNADRLAYNMENDFFLDGQGQYISKNRISKQSDNGMTTVLNKRPSKNAHTRHIDSDYGSADVTAVDNTSSNYKLVSQNSGKYDLYKGRGTQNVAANTIYYRVDNNTISPNVAKENKRVNQILGGNGVVTGSATIYEAIPGLPNDIDIITTPNRRDAVIKNLGLKDSGVRNGIGDSKYTLNEKIYGKDSVDLDIIHESNGHAEGMLAENIFSYVDPYGYNAWRNNNVKLSYDGKVTNPIPYSADELYDMLTSNENGVFGFNVVNYIKSGRIKDNDRVTALIATNPKLVRDSVIRNGHVLFGDKFMSADKLYPNMIFDDIQQNKNFLRRLGLPTEWAYDPEKVMAVVEKYSFEKTTATRGVAKANDFNEFIKSATSPSAYQNVSGPGRNSVEGSNTGGGRAYAVGGISAMQFPLTYDASKVKYPEDLVLIVGRQTKSYLDPLEYIYDDGQISFIKKEFGLDKEHKIGDLIDAINERQSKNLSDTNDIDFVASENERISKALNLPIIRNKGSYNYMDGREQHMSGYVGGLTGDYYGLGYDFGNRRMQLGSLIPQGGTGRLEYDYIDKPTPDLFRLMDKLYNTIGRAYAGNNEAFRKVKYKFERTASNDDLLSHVRNYRQNRRYVERAEDVKLMSKQLKSKYDDMNRRIFLALDKADDIKYVAGKAAVLGGISLPAATGIVALSDYIVRDAQDVLINENQDINNELNNNSNLYDNYKNGDIESVVDYIDKKFNKDKLYTKRQIRRHIKNVLKEKDMKDNEK